MRTIGWNLCLLGVCTAMVIAASGQSFTTLVNFSGRNGVGPVGGLIQGPDGSFYGTTESGGTAMQGTIFRLTRGGVLTTLYNFCSLPNCADGAEPVAGLLLGSDLNLYGTTLMGGANNAGTIFRFTGCCKLTVVYNFCSQANCNDGAMPFSGLAQGSDGNLYGTTSSGGQHGDGTNCLVAGGCGTAFKTTPTGVLTTLHSFCSETNCADGEVPLATLIRGSNQNFYGTTYEGGDTNSSYCVQTSQGCGTVFQINPAGGFTTLHQFSGTDGLGITGGLVQASNGTYYGTAEYGGNIRANCHGNFGCGAIFSMTPAGTVTTLYRFSYNDGSSPYAGLVQGTDGNLYGTTSGGGDASCQGGCGTIFQITVGGALTTLHTFDSADGSYPMGLLLQGTNGSLYGTASDGGTFIHGTAFQLSMGLGPFVSFVRSYGKVGQTDGILGQGFTGTTSVSLAGTPATFKVLSDTFLMATVPTSGITGPVTVTTPTGTLTSSVPFRVSPQLLSFSPTNGPVGTQVTITGVSLTQTTGVGFGDSFPAPFTVNSDTQVTATVPAGAQTGPVGIQTQGGIAISTQTFTVTQ